MKKIFISHSSQNAILAGRLATDLARLGADIWIDLKDIPAGVKWSTAIQEGLDACDVLILIATPASIASKNVEDEWRYFVQHNKPIITVLYQTTNLPDLLSQAPYIDFRNKEHKIKAYSRAFYRLWDKIGTIGETTRVLVPWYRRRIAVVVGLILVILLGGVGFLFTLSNETADNPVIENWSAVWSPDGTQIAFVTNRNEGTSDIYIIDANGKNLRRLTSDIANETGPSWSADGTQIAFISDRYGNNDIFSINSDGTGLKRLTDDPSNDIDPVWYGDAVLFVTNRNGNNDIFIAGEAGVSALIATDSEDEFPIAAGNIILYAVVMDIFNQGYEFYEYNPTTDSSETLFSLAESNYVQWVDQQALIFFGTREGQACLLGVEGQQCIELAETAQLSPDGKTLCFIRDNNLQVMDLATQQIDNLTSADDGCVWSPTSDRIIYSKKVDNDLQLYVVNKNGENIFSLTTKDK